jgi:pimeloyl-ACP methyl ester carboxylesterase
MATMLNALLGRAAASVDRVISGAATQLLARGSASRLDHDGRVRGLRELSHRHHPGHLEDHASFFPGPRADVIVEGREPRDAGEQLELSWNSAHTCFHTDIQPRYDRGGAPNARAVARVYTSGRPGAPAAVLVHGMLCGQWALEERIWPISAFTRWGLDVALLVLPFHAVRGRALATPPFPGADPRMNIEGFRHSIHDLRVLVDWMRARGAKRVGLMGMSLGGYTTALAATLDPVDFLVPIIPVASLADFARDSRRLARHAGQRAEQHQHLDEVYRVASPLARPPRVAGSNVLVIAGDSDRITPRAHAEQLAQHFGARLQVLPGGHLLQAWRGKAFRSVKNLLRQVGVIAPSGG